MDYLVAFLIGATGYAFMCVLLAARPIATRINRRADAAAL